MNGAGSVLLEQAEVFRRPISLVGEKIVVGVVPMVLRHESIAGHFRDDRGRGNGDRKRIAFDHGPLRYRKTRDCDGIDQEKIRTGDEASDGAVHGEPGGLQDVGAIDFAFACEADSHRNGAGANLLVESLALRLGN